MSNVRLRQKPGPARVTRSAQAIKTEPSEPPKLAETSSKPRAARRTLSDASTTADLTESIREQKKCRNRTSAVRHRRRKKEMEDDLDRQEKELVGQNESLRSSIEELKSIRLQMKGLLMSHSMCNFEPIDQYHLQSAQSVTDQSGKSGAKAACDAAVRAVTGPRASMALSATSPESAVLSPVASPVLSEPAAGPSASQLPSRSDNEATSPLSACSDLSMSTSNPFVYAHGAVSPDFSVDQPLISRRPTGFSDDSGYRSLKDMKLGLAGGALPVMDDDSDSLSPTGPDSADVWSVMSKSPNGPYSTDTTPLLPGLPDPSPQHYFCGMDGSYGPDLDGLSFPLNDPRDKDLSMAPMTDDEFLDSFFTTSA